MRAWTPLLLLALIALPVATHLAAIKGGSLLPMICSLALFGLILRPVFGNPGRLATCALFLALFAGGAMVAAYAGNRAILLPPLLVNASLLILFGRTLRPGQQPLITRLAKLYRGRLEPRVAGYTRQITWAWSIVFAGLLIEIVVLALFAPLATASLFANVLNYILVAALFVIEYGIRRWRLADLEHPGFWTFVAFLRQTNWQTFFSGRA